MTFRVALLGSGNISETHARAAVEASGVELVAHWGRTRDSTLRLAREYGGTAYDSAEAALAHPGLDGVLIGTPSGTHATYAIAAARRGLHALVEKPLEISTASVDAVVAAHAAARTTVGVFFQDRMAPDLAWLRDMIAGGGLGTPQLAAASVRWYRDPAYYAGSSWRGTRALDGGGALMNQGIHTVDLLLWLFGDVVRVSARSARLFHRIEVEDTVVATLDFDSGALGTLEVTTAAYPGFPRRVVLTGSEGTVVVTGDRVTHLERRQGGEGPPAHPASGAPGASATSPIVSDATGHRLVLLDFVSAVGAGRAPRCDGAEGRRSVAVIEAIYASAASGMPATPR